MTTVPRLRIAALAFVALAACRHADSPPYLSTDYSSTAPVVTTDAATASDTDTAAEPVADEPTDAPADATTTAGPGGIPLPPDAVVNTQMPAAGGKMSVFEVPRGRAVVGDELKANLAAAGWTIDSEETSPRFQALRL